MDKLLLTPSAAAEVLSVSRTTLYVMLQRGELESLKVGAARRIPADALRDWLDRQRQAAGSSGALV